MSSVNEWQNVTSDGNPMRLFVARPEAQNAPGVIVLQEAFGVNAHIREVTKRIASLGYVAVAPELFHRTAPGFEGEYGNFEPIKPHMAAITPETLESDVRATYDWLKADTQTDASRIASVGYCMGGKASFIANGILPLKAAVSYYGGGIAALLDRYAAKQSAPLLLYWGGKDSHIDVAQRAATAEGLRNAGKTFTQVEFSDAGHGFFCDERESYNAHAAEESWAMMEVFFRNYL